MIIRIEYWGAKLTPLRMTQKGDAYEMKLWSEMTEDEKKKWSESAYKLLVQLWAAQQGFKVAN